MSTETTLISDQLSGHNPDTFGHVCITHSNLTIGHFDSDMHVIICQGVTKSITDYKMNPEIIRTYSDIGQNGSDHRSNSKH
jgi:hypothetical protein